MRRVVAAGMAVVVAVIFVVSTPLPAGAAVIASDAFETYPAGTALNGAADGTGWTNPWTAVAGVIAKPFQAQRVLTAIEKVVA